MGWKDGERAGSCQSFWEVGEVAGAGLSLVAAGYVGRKQESVTE